MPKDKASRKGADSGQDAIRAEVAEAAAAWKRAKAKERAAREQLAELVRAGVGSGLLTENKIAKVTDIPRMTIRKMLGKD